MSYQIPNSCIPQEPEPPEFVECHHCGKEMTFDYAVEVQKNILDEFYCEKCIKENIL